MQAKGYERYFPWSFRFVGYVKRKLQNRKAKYDQETPADRSARRTATATYWIAGFTVVLAVVSYKQWRELQGSGVQTDKLIDLYGKQVGQLRRQSRDTHALAEAAKAQADAAKATADSTKQIADRALDQAKATNDLAHQAKRSADIAMRAMEVSERPWIVRGRDCSCEQPPAQFRARRVTAHGSYLG